MNRQRIGQLARCLMTIALIGVAVPVNAQTVTPFQMVGHIQSFVLDSSVGTGCPASNIGAGMTVNGIDVIIPCHSVILMPAAYKTPQHIL